MLEACDPLEEQRGGAAGRSIRLFQGESGTLPDTVCLFVLVPAVSQSAFSLRKENIHAAAEWHGLLMDGGADGVKREREERDCRSTSLSIKDTEPFRAAGGGPYL